MPMQQDFQSCAPYVLLENLRCGKDEEQSLYFESPIAEICCHEGNGLKEAFREMDDWRQKGFYLCGYIAYEAGYYFSDKQKIDFNKIHSSAHPLLHFYVFERIEIIDGEKADEILRSQLGCDDHVVISHVALNTTRQDYKAKLKRIKQYIKAGDTYQVNFTMKYKFKYEGDPVALYMGLRGRQRVEFGGILSFPEYHVVSLSPELFVRKQGAYLESKPMKGTFARGQTNMEDAEIVSFMKRDQKTLSENVMIVDLIRNDLSRIADKGTVAVRGLCEVQTFETLHQMITTVYGTIQSSVTMGEVMANLFPCGSVTGAPKLRTMEIIEELEVDKRGVYTGAIGWISPENDFCFNVPIRTCLARHDGTAEMGVGAGVLYESDIDAEYEECLLKASFLTRLNETFQLIETMFYDARFGVIRNLDRHIHRLEISARELHFKMEEEHVIDALMDKVSGLDSDGRIRLLLHQDGVFDITVTEVDTVLSSSGSQYVGLSEKRVPHRQLLFRHKTTRRQLYDEEYDRHQTEHGAYDVLFINDIGHVTEASRHNLFIEKNGQYITSPIDSGLLGGVQRAEFLAENMESCVVRPVEVNDLLTADRLILTNSVRGLVDVKLNEQALSMLVAASRTLTHVPMLD